MHAVTLKYGLHVKPQELSKAKNPDLRGSFAGLQRAAELARRIAVQTDTAIVVVQDGKLVRIPAAQLRSGQPT